VDLDDVGKWSTNFTGELGGGGLAANIAQQAPRKLRASKLIDVLATEPTKSATDIQLQ
jgi:hypothetical protein